MLVAVAGQSSAEDIVHIRVASTPWQCTKPSDVSLLTVLIRKPEKLSSNNVSIFGGASRERGVCAGTPQRHGHVRHHHPRVASKGDGDNRVTIEELETPCG